MLHIAAPRTPATREHTSTSNVFMLPRRRPKDGLSEVRRPALRFIYCSKVAFYAVHGHDGLDDLLKPQRLAQPSTLR